MTRGNVSPDEWRDLDADVVRGTPRILGMSLIVFVIVLVLIVAAGAFMWVWAPWKGKVEQRNLTEGSGSYRIAAYESFYDTCEAIVALEAQITVMEADTSLPKDQRATNVLALTNKRITLIQEYNANSRKEDTRANFKASDLPYQIDLNGETVCTA